MTREHHPDTYWYNFAEFLCYEKKMEAGADS